MATKGVWPDCMRCDKGVLIPLSDYGQEGAAIIFKAWTCINPACNYTLRVDKGEVSVGKVREDGRQDEGRRRYGQR